MSRNHKTSGARDTSHAAALRHGLKEKGRKVLELPAVDTGGWPNDIGAAAQRGAEAEALAKRLGHKLTPWIWRDDLKASQARCEVCAEIALVRPKSWHGAPLGGPALTFGCKK